MRRLPLKLGDHVLDVGCGPGLWTHLFAERIGPQGHVIGVDLADDLLQFARQRNQDLLDRGVASFVHQDLDALSDLAGSADLVFCANSYGYVESPITSIRHHMDLVKPGGTLVLRHFDNSASVFSHIPPFLQHVVLSGVARGVADAAPAIVDCFFGRSLPGALVACGISSLETLTDAVQLTAPLSSDAETYLQMKGRWYGEIAQPYIAEAQFSQWMSYFDGDDDNYVLSEPGFYFSTIEVQATVHMAGTS